MTARVLVVRAIAIKVATVIARTTLVATNNITLNGAGSSSTVTIGAGASGTNTFGSGAIPSNITLAGLSAGSGGTGSVLMAGGAGTNWATTSAKTTMSGQLTLEGENPDIMIGGKSMVSWMQKVEQRLSILEPKPELLAKYEALQQAFDHYKTLEALLHGTENDS